MVVIPKDLLRELLKVWLQWERHVFPLTSVALTENISLNFRLVC